MTTPTIPPTFNFWDWMREKVMPTLIIALVLGVGATYVQTIRLIDAHTQTRVEVGELKAEIGTIREAYVKRVELTEIMKRVEQQQEIILLKARESGRK